MQAKCTNSNEYKTRCKEKNETKRKLPTHSISLNRAAIFVYTKNKQSIFIAVEKLAFSKWRPWVHRIGNAKNSQNEILQIFHTRVPYMYGHHCAAAAAAATSTTFVTICVRVRVCKIFLPQQKAMKVSIIFSINISINMVIFQSIQINPI